MSQKALEEFQKVLANHLDPNMQRTIELDCPPGGIRPGDLIADVIAGTGLLPREPVAKVFGNWKWDYNDIPAEEWKKIQPLLKERISVLYNNGTIRYGSW